MKKLFLIVMTICVLSFVVSATDANVYVYEYSDQNLTVEFAEDTVFSQDDRQIIADIIAYNTPMQQTYSLCWLLGHEFYTESVSAIYHEKSEYDPRCQWELYEVEKCRNCDHLYPTLVSSCYISCCPPETSAVSLD